ncbi:unnamed protein product (mitochondrion) [Plasmodiophora brassicae]|uniref:Uncharacterized protein n=1 Tax=Plasmodiophora brassicae TaxID=37360 RepID=A0A3P3Y8B6_PLABS|nr:unnamed protein product [Plasmodiophora brassicae]
MTTGSPSSSQADPRRPRADDDAKHAADHADARSRSVSRGERDDDVWAAAFRKARNRADMEGEPATDHDGSVDQVDAENGCRSRQGVQNDDADPSGRDGIESSAINGAQQEVDERQVQRDDVGPSGPEGNDVAVIDSVHEGDDRSAETDPLDLSCLLSGSLESESSNCDVNSEIDEDQSDEDQSDEDQSDEDQSDEDQSDEDQSDEDQSDEDQSDEDQSDEDQSDEDQSDEDQSDEDQSDEDQSDEDQSDEDQSDEDQSDEDRPEASTDRNEVDEDQCESVDDPLGADIVAKAVSVDPVRRDTCLNSLVSASAYKKDDAEDDDSLLVKRRRWCRRAICAVMLSSVLVLSVYIGMVGIQLGKLASSQFFMVDMAIDSLCSDRITVNFDGVLFNPSTASLGISDVAFAVSTDGFSKPFLKGAIPLPQFTTSRQSSSVLGPGDNLVNIAMRLNVLNRAAVSELLARSVAKTPTHVKVSFTAMLSLQPLFLLPITFPFSGNEIVVLNEPTGAPRPNPPQVTSIAITADSPKQGLLATIAWEMEALLPGVRLSVPLPEINAKILSQGKVVALATNRAATLSPKKGNFTSTVQIPTQQSTSELLRTQALIRSIASGADDLSIQVTGVPSPGQPPSCMLQDVIDQMPPVTFQLALTSPMSSNVGNGFSSSGAVLHSVSSPSNSRPKPSPPSNGLLGDVSVDIVNVRRAADNPFGIVLNVETSVMVQWTMDVQLTQIVFDLMVAGTSLMAVITILPVSVIVVESGRRVPVKLTIDIELADEQLAVSLLHRSMANGFHDLPQLTICGRSGSNFLSRLFTQVSIPIPIPPRGVRPSIPNIDYSIVVDASCDLNVFVTAPAFKGAAAKASSQSTSSLPPITVIVPGGQPMLITSGREYHVKLDIEIGTTSFTRERRLTDILARVLLEGGHSRIAIHLVPQHNAASDLTPFYSWVNLTKIPMTSRFKFEIVRIDPIGNVDSDGMTDLEIPCFMRGSLCPYDRTGLVTSFGLILQIGLKITTAVVSSPFVLTFPECSFTVDYGTFPVLDITVQPMSLTLPTMFSNGGLDFFFNVTIESMDTEMLGAAYDGLMQSSQRRAVIRAHPSAGPYANFVSRIFSGVSFEVPIDRSKPSTGNSSGFVFEYALVSTNSYSAGFKMVTKLPFTAPFDISWGNVRIALHWKGEAFADATTDLTLAKGALLHRDIYARVFGENVDPMKQCDVQDFINPKMCVANSVLQLALAAAQGNTSLPLVVDLQFTNMFGIHQRWWMDLTVFEAIPTISRKSTASKSYGLLRALSVNTNKLFSSLRNSLSKRFVEVPMYAKIYNPLNFVLACNRIDGKLFFTDLDGVHSGYIPFVRLPPTPEVKLASVKEQNHWELHPLTVTTIDDLTFNVDRHQVIETGLRLFDEKILHNRLCIDVDKGVLDIEIRAPNSEPLLFTQILTLHKFESQGHEDCKLAPECHPKMAFVPGFDTAHFADPSILVNGDGAKIARNGSAVDITTGRHQFTSVFWRQPVRIDDSFSFTMTFRMQGFAILSNGIAFVVQGEGPEAFSRNKWGLGLGRSSELAIVFSNQFSTAIYVMRDGVEIARTHETIVAYDDGKFHTARIDYTHQSERVDVYIDDKHVLVANFNTALLKLARNRAWIGVTASTEWLTYSIQTIELMSLSRPVLHVPMFVLVEKGLITGSTLHPSRFTLEARDSCGFPRYSGEPVTFCVALRPQRDDGDCSIDAASSCLIDLTDAIADNHDGTYTVEFTPDRDGMFDVLVRTADAATPGRWIRLGDIQIEPVFD